MTDYILGLDLGGTRLKAAILGKEHEVLETFYCNRGVEKDIRDMSRNEWKNLICRYLDEMYKKYDSAPVSFGISIPGIPNITHTQIARMPQRLTEVEQLDWSELLGFSGQIYVINDAKAAFLAELNSADMKHIRNAFMLTLGTGVGGAAMVDGCLLEGRIGRAGHLGHMSIDAFGPQAITNIPGGLDYRLGNYSLKERSGGLFKDSKDLEDAFVRNEPLAVELWLKMVRELAVGISSLINILDPEMVILGGGIVNAGERLLGPLKDYMEQFEWRPYGDSVPICRAKQGDFSGAVGAAIFADRKMN